MKTTLYFQKSAALLCACLVAATMGAGTAQAQGPGAKVIPNLPAPLCFSLSTYQLQGLNGQESSSQGAYASILGGLDPRNLEAFIRYESLDSYTRMNSGIVTMPAGGVFLDLDAAAPDAWHEAVHAVADTPASGLALFQFDMPPITSLSPGTSSPTPDDPTIEGCWIGLGGHRLVAAGAPFPIVLFLRGGTAPWSATLHVSRNGASWTIPVNLQANEEGRFELEVSASDNPETDLYRVELVRSQAPDANDVPISRQFRMMTDRNSVYWITPGVAGRHTKDALLAVVNAHPTSKDLAGNMSPRRLEPVSPDVLPTDVRGWSPAQTVVIGPGGEQAMSPAAKAALLAWVESGGHLGVLQGSSLPAQAPAGTGSTKTLLKVGQGEIDIAPAGAGDGTYPLQRPDSNFITADHAIEPGIRTFAAWALALNAGPNLGNPNDTLYRLAAAKEPILNVPGWPVFAAGGLCYVAIFGPFSLWLMRRVRRILLVWLVVPALASVLGLVVLVAGSSVHHALRTLNVSTVQIVPSGSSTGLSQSDMLFFTPEPGDYRINIGQQTFRSSDALIAGGIADEQSSTEHDLALTAMPSYSEQHVHLDAVVKVDGALQIVRYRDGSIELVNGTHENIPQSILIASKYYNVVRGLPPGATVTLSKPGSFQWNPIDPASQPAGYLNRYLVGFSGIPFNPTNYANGSGSEIRWVFPESPLKTEPPDHTSGTRNCVLVVTEGTPSVPAGKPGTTTGASTIPTTPAGYPSGYPGGGGYPGGYPSGYPHS